MTLSVKKANILQLGELEMAIMKVLWERKEATGKEVWEALKGKRDIAITTVLTVIERLFQKGFVDKLKDEGPFTFRPAVAKDEFAREASKKVLLDFIELSSGSTMVSFLDALTEVDPEGIDRLTAFIEKKRKEMADE